MKNCIRDGSYQFALTQIDKENMVYQDLSQWTVGPGNYTVTITKPASSQSVDVEVSGTENTRISKSEIGTIVDGIYKFEAVSCGLRYTRYKGLFYNLECCIMKAYKDVSPRLYPLVKDTEQHLKMTKSAIETGELERANTLFEITQEKIDRIKCDCGC